MSAPAPNGEPTRTWRIVLVLLVPPILFLGWRTGSRIAAEREADAIVRPLCAVTVDGRPEPRALLHVQRGSSALLETLDRLVREGPYEDRAGLSRALGLSGRLELLRPLVLQLRDGCVDPDSVALPPRPGFPCPVYPFDELALARGDEGRAAMGELADRDRDPTVRAWAETHLVATRARPIGPSLDRVLAGPEALLRERASWIAADALADARHLAPGAVPGLVGLARATPRGRLLARLLARCGPTQVPASHRAAIEALSAELTPADVRLAEDERAAARLGRAFARGDATAAALLAELAPREPLALEALVAAVGSRGEAARPELREAAVAALASLARTDPRARAALEAAGAR